MPVSLVIVDDFLGDPDAVRHRAVGLTYAQSGAFPGLNSLERIELDGLDEAVSDIVNEPLLAQTQLESHGKCRLTLQQHNRPGKIHVDPSHWSGILYLTRPEDCRGGTEFYRHLPTETDQVPTDIEGLHAIGYDSYPQMKSDILERDAIDRSKWELTQAVPMRYNRLVLLRPWLWHTSGPGFGTSVENGRLIYVMFFKQAYA